MGKLFQDACGFPKITWFGKQISNNSAVKTKVVNSICEPVRGKNVSFTLSGPLVEGCSDQINRREAHKSYLMLLFLYGMGDREKGTA